VPSKHSIGAVIYIDHRDRWRCEFQCYPGELLAVDRLLAWRMAIILILEHFRIFYLLESLGEVVHKQQSAQIKPAER
jgi:hypothetical protein